MNPCIVCPEWEFITFTSFYARIHVDNHIRMTSKFTMKNTRGQNIAPINFYRTLKSPNFKDSATNFAFTQVIPNFAQIHLFLIKEKKIKEQKISDLGFFLI